MPDSLAAYVSQRHWCLTGFGAVYNSCAVQSYAPELYVLEATLDTLSSAGPNLYSSFSSLYSSSDFSRQSRLPPIASSEYGASQTGRRWITPVRLRQCTMWVINVPWFGRIISPLNLIKMIPLNRYKVVTLWAFTTNSSGDEIPERDSALFCYPSCV